MAGIHELLKAILLVGILIWLFTACWYGRKDH